MRADWDMGHCCMHAGRPWPAGGESVSDAFAASGQVLDVAPKENNGARYSNDGSFWGEGEKNRRGDDVGEARASEA